MYRNKELSSETRQSILVLRNDGYSMREISKKLKISYNAVYYSLHRTAQTGSNQIRKRSGRPRCTAEQEDKYIRVSGLRNRRLTSPQLTASLNSTRITPVSTSTVKRRLWDAGLHQLLRHPDVIRYATLGQLLWALFISYLTQSVCTVKCMHN
jgi:transposase